MLIVSLVGCDGVFGLRDVNLEPDLPRVEVSYLQRYAYNNAQYEPVVAEQPFPAFDVEYSVVLADGTEPTITYNPDGSFSFPRASADQEYRISVTANSATIVYQHTVAALTIADRIAGRADAVPVPQGQAMNVTFNVPPRTGTAYEPYVVSTGVWTESTTNSTGPSVTFNFRDALPALEGIKGLLDPSKFDRLYAVDFADYNAGATPYRAIRATSSAALELGDMSKALPDLVEHPLDQCVKVDAPNQVEIERIKSAVGRASYPVQRADWQLRAVPDAVTLGRPGALAVAYSISPDNTVLDINADIPFHNPYIGHTMILQGGSIALFETALPGTLPILLPDHNRRWVRATVGPAAQCPAATTLAGTVGLGVDATLDGVVLTVDNDNQEITLDLSRDPQVSWTYVGGPVHHGRIALYELVNVNGTTTIALRQRVHTSTTSALLDRTSLVSGRTYIIEIATRLGLPLAVDGDLATVELPMEDAITWTGSFRVR